MKDNTSSELESLSGCLFKGNPTPLVFKLLKDTKYKMELLSYLTSTEQVQPVVEEEEVKPAVIDFMDIFNNGKIID